MQAEYVRFWREVIPYSLEPYLEKARPNGDVEVLCTFHHDDTPSLSVNLKTGYWHCKVPDCPSNSFRERKAGGDSVQFLQYYYEVSERAALDLRDYFMAGNSFRGVFPVPAGLIVEWEDNLWGSQEHQEYLIEERGFNQAVLRQLQIGYDKRLDRTTFPVYNSRGHVINVREHSRKGHASGKVINYSLPNNITSLGSPPRLWPLQLVQAAHQGWNGKKFWIVAEGEMDVLAGLSAGLGTVFTSTGGAGSFPKVKDAYITHPEYLQGKVLAVVYDADSAGYQGGKLVAQLLLLRFGAREVRQVILPEEGADLNSYFVGKHTVRDFVELLDKTVPTEKNTDELQGISGGSGLPEVYEAFDLDQLVDSPDNYGPSHPKELLVRVIGTGREPRVIPRVVRWECKPVSDNRTCKVCALSRGDNELKYRILPSASALELLTSTSRMHGLLRSTCNINPTCRRIKTVFEDMYHVHALQVEASQGGPVARPSTGDHLAFYFQKVNDPLPWVGRRYFLRGWTDANPIDRGRILVAAEMAPLEDEVVGFKLSEDMAKRLDKLYGLARGQSVDRKLADIYQDQSRNVTRILNRELLHMAVDLVMFSVLQFQWKGLREKGRLDAVVVGDTGTAKSKVAMKLLERYGLGKILSGETASYAGLAGGAQNIPGIGWLISWGQLPRQDLRAVVIDEMTGLGVDDVSNLTSVRSEEGTITFTKVVHGEAPARTRILWLSNPRRGDHGQVQLLDERYGVSVLQDLFGTAEDVRRLDFALMLTADEVDMTDIEAELTAFPPEEAKYDAQSDQALLLWTWSRNLETLDQVVWEEDAIHLVDVYSDEARLTYHPVIPLVSTDFSKKLARMAIAVAARLFSHPVGNYEAVLVREGHIRAAWTFLQTIYGARCNGYLALSRARYQEESRAAGAEGKVMNYLQLYPELYALLRNGRIGTRVLETIIPREELPFMLGELVSGGLLIPNASGYAYKTTKAMNHFLDEFVKTSI